MKDLHKGLEEIKNIDYIGLKNEGGPASICKLNFKLYSFQSRDFVLCFSIKKINNSIVLIAKNCKHSEAQISKSHIRGNMHFCLIIDSKSKNLCKITYLSYVDLCGSVNTKLYSNALLKRPVVFIPKLNEIILKRKTENVKRPLEHYKILDTYDEIIMNENKKN